MGALLGSWVARLIVAVVGVAVVGGVAYTRLTAPPPRPELRTATVQRANLTQTVTVAGTVNPSAQVRLAFKSAGRLAEVFVKTGQEVRAGDRLARLDETDQRIAVAQAEANLASAQAKYASALAGEDIASLRLSVENAERTLDRLVANYNAAKANLDLLYQRTLADRDGAETQVALARATAATLQQELASASSQSTDVKNATTTAGTIQTNVQQVQLQLALLDAALADLRVATSALQAEIAQADAGRPDAQRYDPTGADASAGRRRTDAANAAFRSYNAAQTAYGGSLSRAQSAVEATQSPLAAVISNANAVLAALGTSATRGESALDGARADASALVQQAGTAQQHLTRAKSTLGSLTSTAATITDAITGATVANAQQSLATTRQSLQSKLNTREADLQVSLAAVRSAEAALEKDRNALANAVLTAPAAGIIAQVNAQPGEFVAGGTTANPFVLLAATSSLALHGTIGEADVARLRLGQVATVTVDAIGTEKRLTGRVTAIDPVASVQQGVPVYGVDVTLEIEEPAIRPGMSGTAAVIIATKRDALVVPNLAVRNLGGRRGVQVLRNGEPVDVVDVQFGIANEQFTEVLAGLEAGEVVVLPTPRAAATPAIRFGPAGPPAQPVGPPR